MVNCCVPYCTSKSGKNTNVTFHEIPSNYELRFKWLKVISRQDFIPSDNTHICSIHFKDADFLDCARVRRLKKNAIPSIFPGYPSYKIPKLKPPRRQLIRKPYFPPPKPKTSPKKAEQTAPVFLDVGVQTQINTYRACTDVFMSKRISGNVSSCLAETQTSIDYYSEVSKIHKECRFLSSRVCKLKKKVNNMKKQYEDIMSELKYYDESRHHQALQVMLHDNSADDHLILVLELLKNHYRIRPRFASRAWKMCYNWLKSSPRGYAFTKRNILSLPNKATLKKLLNKEAKDSELNNFDKAVMQLFNSSNEVDSSEIPSLPLIPYTSPETNYDTNNAEVFNRPSEVSVEVCNLPTAENINLPPASKADNYNLSGAESIATLPHTSEEISDNITQTDTSGLLPNSLKEMNCNLSDRKEPTSSCVLAVAGSYGNSEGENISSIPHTSTELSNFSEMEPVSLPSKEFLQEMSVAKTTLSHTATASTICDTLNEKEMVVSLPSVSNTLTTFSGTTEVYVVNTSDKLCDQNEMQKKCNLNGVRKTSALAAVRKAPASKKIRPTSISSKTGRALNKTSNASTLNEIREASILDEVPKTSSEIEEPIALSEIRTATTSGEIKRTTTLNEMERTQPQCSTETVSTLSEVGRASTSSDLRHSFPSLPHTVNELEDNQDDFNEGQTISSLPSCSAGEIGEEFSTQTDSTSPPHDSNESEPLSPHLCPLFCCHTQLMKMYMVELRDGRILINCLSRD